MVDCLTPLQNLTVFQQELLKLALQFAGAMFIAWMTVHWALGRFKSEKMWERRTTALADVLVALGEMKLINELWEEHEASGGGESPEINAWLNGLSKRYQAAHRQFRGVAAVASLILPSQIVEVMTTLLSELNADYDEPRIDEVRYLSSVIGKARQELVALGRSLQS